MGVADVGPRRSGAFARRFPGTRDQTTLGGKILHPREALDIVNFVEEYEAEDLPDAGDRLQQRDPGLRESTASMSAGTNAVAARPPRWLFVGVKPVIRPQASDPPGMTSP